MRRRQRALITRAQAACRKCPLIIDCLYSAVVDHNVAGYVAGTTPPQRAQIRRSLGITVEPEDFDTLAGVTGPHRKVSHSEVIRLRNANPHGSLEMLAQPFGCSLSTIKRHVRRERRRPLRQPPSRSPPPPRCSPQPPSSPIRRSCVVAPRPLCWIGALTGCSRVPTPSSRTVRRVP